MTIEMMRFQMAMINLLPSVPLKYQGKAQIKAANNKDNRKVKQSRLKIQTYRKSNKISLMKIYSLFHVWNPRACQPVAIIRDKISNKNKKN